MRRSYVEKLCILGLIWLAVLVCGHSRKYTINEHLRAKNYHIKEQIGGGNYYENEDLGHNNEKLLLNQSRHHNHHRHRARRIALGVVLGALTGIACATAVVCLVRVSVKYFNRTPLMKGPIVFDSRLDTKIVESLEEEACEVVGSGPNGSVLKVCIDCARITLAMKRIEFNLPMDSSLKRMIQEELIMVGKAKHENLVALMAYIPSPTSHLLVYDFFPHGNLDDVLGRARENKVCLNWAARQKIAVGVILGLEYLHFQCNPPIVHCNLKPTNILLGEDFEPFVTDFGLSKLLPNCGVLGYVAPECVEACRYTDKSDVFSFGVVLAVLLSGREPTESFPNGSIGKWLRHLQQTGKGIEALDKSIVGEEDEEGEDKHEEMLMAVRIAAACLADSPADRPSSAELVPMLTQLHSF